MRGHHLTRASVTLCVLQAEAQELIIACDCPQYLQKAERRLGEEVSRVREYLDASTEARVTRVAETALIQQQVGQHSSLACEYGFTGGSSHTRRCNGPPALHHRASPILQTCWL